MKRKRQDKKASKIRREHEAEGVVAGALAGAAMGGVAGPPGAIAGGLLGGAMGAAAAAALTDAAEERAARDAKLDEEIGVVDGDLGAPNLEHPPARTGAYGRESSGGGGSAVDAAPAEGPMQPPDS